MVDTAAGAGNQRGCTFATNFDHPFIDTDALFECTNGSWKQRKVQPIRSGRSITAWDRPGRYDFWFNIPENAVYYLEVDNRQGSEPFRFVAFNSDLTKVQAQLDEVYTLPFAGRGDRIRLEIELQRGQRISGIRPTAEGPVPMVFAGPNGLPIQVKEHWYDPDPAVWLVPDSGVYTLEFRNASDSPNDVSIQLKEQPPIAIGRSFITSDTVVNGNLTRTSENAGSLEVAFRLRLVQL